MQHLPLYVNTQDALIVVSGAGETAAAKLRILLKTQARIRVCGCDPTAAVRSWRDEGRIELLERPVEAADVAGSRLIYAANDDALEDGRVASLGREAGAIVNVVDNLAASDFITPALIDREPLTVAIGTEGTAPVLARQLKAQIEAQLDHQIGELARIGKDFRAAASGLPRGRQTRAFWSEFYEHVGPAALAERGEAGARAAIAELLSQHLSIAYDAESRTRRGHVWLIGAGPGDPDLLTNKARRALHDADVVIHDRLVSSEVLELARREATFVEVGKTPGGKSWRQDDINSLMVHHARNGKRVARVKSGDPTIYGRLDEEMDALDSAAVPFEIVSGVTSVIAAAANLKVSLTKRKRNSDFRLLTGQDINGFAEQDWRTLARPGSVAAIYMGLRAARFLQGRLLMHGAAPETPVSVVENISRKHQKVIDTTLAALTADIQTAELSGPAVILFGISPRSHTRSDMSELPADTALATAIGANS